MPSIEQGHRHDSSSPERRAARLPDSGIWPELNKNIALFPPQHFDKIKTSIVIDKPRRVLTLLVDGWPVVAYPLALGFSPTGDKVRQGDGRTPEGEFYLTRLVDRGLAARFGPRAVYLSYPNAEDADRGLRAGLINQAQHRAIMQAIAAGSAPPGNTALGGGIRIHGGGIESDWTRGCVALRDPDMLEVYDRVQLRTPVKVLGANDKPPFGDHDDDGIADAIDVLLGAKKSVINAAQYDGTYYAISSTGGDVARNVGVCTDVVIRALRNAGVDLQALVQQDRAAHPASYPRIKKPDPSIDHRRVPNLIVWFRRHWQALSTSDFKSYRPGDVVFFDGGFYAGPDHVGVVADRVGASGNLLVIHHLGGTPCKEALLGQMTVVAAFRWQP